MRLQYMALSAIMIVAVSACGDSNGGSATFSLGEFCDPSFSGDCPNSFCRNAVGGESCDNTSCSDWSQASNQGTICTKSCADDGNCTGINFAATNAEQVSSEEWFCAGGTCNVLVTAPAGMEGDLCTGCGGIFCSGRCIGCPQC